MTTRRAFRGPVVVGVDLGGTWIRVVAVSSEGTRLRSFKSRAPELAELPEFLQKLWQRWGVTRVQVSALVVATRGVWTAPERRQHERRLGALARRVTVLSDAQAAYLGALGERPGLLVLAGTGSIVVGRTSRGRWVRRGGFGPLLGDEGSAFWIGREWLRATTQGEDFEPVRRMIRASDPIARIASMAVKVLGRATRENRLARRIVADAQRHLADLAVEAAQALRLPGPVPISWAGRLLEDQSFRAGLWRALRRSGLSLRVIPPREAPVLATARLALALHRRHQAATP